jgi:hypothetical protein
MNVTTQSHKILYKSYLWVKHALKRDKREISQKIYNSYFLDVVFRYEYNFLLRLIYIFNNNS